MTSPPYTVICREHDDRAAWLAARKLGIGASDAATVMGCGFLSEIELWAIKTGEVQAEDLIDQEDNRLHWGHEHEATILRNYSSPRYAGRPAERSGELLRSTLYPWAQATLDGWTEHGAHGRIPLEIKTAEVYQQDKWLEGPPERYWWQVQHQMMVTGAPAGSIACLLGVHSLVWADVERDDLAIARLVERCEAFWDRVERRDPPRPDGSESARRAIGAMFSEPEPRKVVRLDGEEWVDLDVRREAARARLYEVRAELDEIENALRMKIGNAEVAVLPDGTRYTLREITRPSHVVRGSTYRQLRRRAPRH